MSIEEQIKALYLDACETELQAFKPGNVSVYSAGHDMTVEDFRVSAQASAVEITNSAYSLGEKIYYAVKATRDKVGCNTNLGIILLCAPMIEAAYNKQPQKPFQHELADVLANTTVEDANWVFKAISLASPGGLGDSEQEDVSQQASMTLTEAMSIAKDKDRIARQYVTGFKDIFDFTVKVYSNAYGQYKREKWAAVAVFLSFLSNHTDSHIERKYGTLFTELVKSLMTLAKNELENAGEPNDIVPLLHSIDQVLKFKSINPGTTADMTVATVLAVNLLYLFHKK